MKVPERRVSQELRRLEHPAGGWHMAKPPSNDIPQQVRRFAPKDRARLDPTDEAGHALLALLHQANEHANETFAHASGFADQVAAQLRAVEERIKELEAEIAHYRARATNAEDWLQRIQHEISNLLISPRPK
jgi:ABC-type transporter Mla subunit MlaD